MINPVFPKAIVQELSALLPGRQYPRVSAPELAMDDAPQIGVSRAEVIPEARQLIISFDVRTADNSVYLKSPHLESLPSALPQMGLVKAGDVELRLVPIAECDLDRALKTPRAPLQVPISIELFYSEDPGKLVLRSRVGFDHYDGVTCVCVALNVLEYLESGSVAETSRLAKANPSPGDHPVTCYLRMLKLALRNAGHFSHDALLWLASRSAGRRFEPISGTLGSFLQEMKGEKVGYRRYRVPEEIGFRDYVRSLCERLMNLGFKGFIYTINYQPKVALAVTPDWEPLLRRDIRTNGMFMPPRPVNLRCMFSLLFASHVLYNNYGRHQPRISGEIVDINWYSPGMLSHVTMALTLTIGSRTWLVFRARKTCQERLREEMDWLEPC